MRRRLALAGSVAVLGMLGAVGLAVSGRLWSGRENREEDRETTETGWLDGLDGTGDLDGVSEAGDMSGGLSGDAAGQTLAGESTPLPSKFDLRERGVTFEVPDQGIFGTCWAFASLKALETSMPESMRTPLAADHMSIKNSFGLGQDDGGDHSMSSSYLLAWQGPVAESEDPYGDGSSPDGLEPVCHVQEIRLLADRDFETIKRAVYEVGGVQSSFYMPQTAGAERDRYYRESTCSFYYNGLRAPNHDTVIIGWDDGYPKENFVEQPEQDGAFLCMNTWGEGFGDEGFFYVSYSDSRIGTSSVLYTGIESTDNYDRIFQSDLCGWTGQMGYGTADAWFANVYEAEQDVTLAAAGFYATEPGSRYRIYVLDGTGESGELQTADRAVREPEKALSAGSAGRVLVAEGELSDAGFYTIPWDQEMFVDAGEWFAVVVEIHSPGATEPVAIEYRAGSRTANVDISDGEGYISSDGMNWERTETAHQCNVCLKVYAADR